MKTYFYKCVGCKTTEISKTTYYKLRKKTPVEKRLLYSFTVFGCTANYIHLK